MRFLDSYDIILICIIGLMNAFLIEAEGRATTMLNDHIDYIVHLYFRNS
jgi:hypothetical protein